MDYRIRFVSDDVMPDGVDWAFCRKDGAIVLCLRESARSLPADEAAAVLEGAWTCWRDELAAKIA